MMSSRHRVFDIVIGEDVFTFKVGGSRYFWNAYFDLQPYIIEGIEYLNI